MANEMEMSIKRTDYGYTLTLGDGAPMLYGTAAALKRAATAALNRIIDEVT